MLVAPAVIGNRGAKKPGIAGIKRPGLEGETVEGCGAFRLAEQLLAKAHAQIARHGDTDTAIAHGVTDAVMGADMGQVVECVGNKADPGVADLGGFQFGEQAHKIGVEQWCTDLRIGFIVRHAAAEQDPASVRRCPVIIDHLAGVADGAAFRHQLVHEVLRHRFCGDNVAADGNDTAALPWGHGGCVTIACNDNVAGLYAAPGGGDGIARAIALDGVDPAMGNNRCPCCHHPLKQSLVIAAGVERGVFWINGTAEIGIRAQLGAHLGARHHMGFALKAGQLVLGTLREKFILLRAVCGVKPATDIEAALDMFGGDEVLDPDQCVVALAKDRTGLFRAVLGGQFVV